MDLDDGVMEDFPDINTCRIDSAIVIQEKLAEDEKDKPMWVVKGISPHIFLEVFHPRFEEAQGLLVAIAEPICRTAFMHEWQLTRDSLFAAVCLGKDCVSIVKELNSLCKIKLAPEVIEFIMQCTTSFGKVRLVLVNCEYWLESKSLLIIQELHQDEVMAAIASKVDSKIEMVTINNQEEHSDQVYRFRVTEVERAKERCRTLGKPCTMIYDYRQDAVLGNVEIALKYTTRLRRYQQIALNKMFVEDRALCGVIVLPCGAGKTLVGVAATSYIQKKTLVVVQNNVAVDQWVNQFVLWSTIAADRVTRFTSGGNHEELGDIVVTTYSMLNYSGKRSEATQKFMDNLEQSQWGLLLLDEVHVVPAAMFRRVIDLVKTNCILGLTATLLREDDKIDDLAYLVGPKLYEANWLELSRDGMLASVMCADVRCPMTQEFYHEYLHTESDKRRTLLHIMNPNKFLCTRMLIDYHERKGDKVLVFSDSLPALEFYAKVLERPFIHGKVDERERLMILDHFKKGAETNTIFISKVGDTSIDLPEATVIIQISSNFGSRRQEAQRLGRILRAKPRGAGGGGGSNVAYFYSLVSNDTSELFYASKRQRFLLDQGYSYTIINSDDIVKMCNEQRSTEGLNSLSSYSNKDEKNMLNMVISWGDEHIDLYSNERFLPENTNGAGHTRSNVKSNRAATNKRISQEMRHLKSSNK